MPDEQVELSPIEEIKEEIVEEEPAYGPPPEEMVEESVETTAPVSDSPWRNDHYALGQAVGLTREEVEAFGNPDAFDRVVQKFVSAHEQMTGETPDLTTPRQFEAGDGEPAQLPFEQTQEEQPLEKFEFEDEDDYDDGILQLKNFVNEHVASTNSQMRTMHVQNNRLQAEAAGRELDAILSSMDDDLFGSGRLNDVDEDRGARRIQVAQEIATMGREIVGSGETLPPLEQMAKKAADAVFGNELRNQTLKRASKRSRKVASQAATPPTHRESDPDKGFAAAVAAAAKWQRDNGDVSAVDDAFVG
jgi:hypothetical protein